jgi:acetylornithine deacetylase/succinyl-diaminopimelate desuccinylase-like protein
MVLGREDIKRIHGTDERISVAGMARAVRFFTQLVRNTCR